MAQSISIKLEGLFEDEFHKRLIGQDKAVNAAFFTLRGDFLQSFDYDRGHEKVGRTADSEGGMLTHRFVYFILTAVFFGRFDNIGIIDIQIRNFLFSLFEITE